MNVHIVVCLTLADMEFLRLESWSRDVLILKFESLGLGRDLETTLWLLNKL